MTDYKISDPAAQAVEPGPMPHPGEWVRRNLLEPFSVNVAEAARRMKVNRPTFNNVVVGKHGISRELAYRLEALFGVDADLLLAMQAAFDSDRDRGKRQAYARQIERISARELADA